MNKEEKRTKRHRAIGVALFVLAMFTGVVAKSIVRFVFTKRADLHISPFQIVFIRSAVQSLIVGVMMCWNRVHPYNENKRHIPALCLYGVFKIMNEIFQIISLKYLDMGPYTIIMVTNPVFTAIFGMIFLKERCSVFNTMLGLISFVGVVFVQYPVLEFGHEHNTMLNYLKGITATFAALIFYSSCLVSIRRYNKIEHIFYLAVFYPSWMGALAMPPLMLASKSDVVVEELQFSYWAMLILAGILYFISMYLVVIGLKYEEANIGALIHMTEVFWGYLYDIVIAHQYPHGISIAGIFLVVSAIVAIGLNRIYLLEERFYKWLENPRQEEKRSLPNPKN